MSDLKYWVGFNRIQGIGRARFSQLEGYFGDLERAWKASAAELRRRDWIAKSIESHNRRTARHIARRRVGEAGA